MKLKQNEIMDKCVDHDHDRWKLLLFFKQKKINVLLLKIMKIICVFFRWLHEDRNYFRC